MSNRLIQAACLFMLACLLLASCSPAANPAPTLTPPPLTAIALPSPTPPLPIATPKTGWRVTVDGFAQYYVKNTPLAGMTLAIRHKGSPDWVQGYGMADLEKSIPAEADTVYEIGSLSKQFTAAAVMQLVEQGQLDLATPISTYLPGLPKALQGFTLHQLMTHTSLIYDTEKTGSFVLGKENLASADLLQRLVPMMEVVPSPAFNWIYANSNYLLAGLIIEKVRGMSYDSYLQEKIIAAAGLKHTAYCLPPPAKKASGYIVEVKDFAPFALNLSAVHAAGAVCSTAGDLLDWVDALSSGKVVSLASYRKMITAEQYTDQYGHPVSYGYGLFIQQSRYGLEISHGGNTIGFISNLEYYPEKGLTIAQLSNTNRVGANPLTLVDSAIVPAILD